MATTPLLLGPVAFQDFEVPECLAFGGHQRLAIHRLPDGRRVIDALGRDDATLVWSGVFSGPDAADRARLLDALRVAGQALPLIWDAFYYTVVVGSFIAEYSSPWWIPYRIGCVVVQDEAAAAVGAAIDLGTMVLNDLSTAASCGVDVSGPQAALAQVGASVPGGTNYAAARAALNATGAALEGELGASESQLGSGDFAAMATAAGQLAQLSTARGYVARAAANLANAGSGSGLDR